MQFWCRAQQNSIYDQQAFTWRFGGDSFLRPRSARNDGIQKIETCRSQKNMNRSSSPSFYTHISPCISLCMPLCMCVYVCNHKFWFIFTDKSKKSACSALRYIKPLHVGHKVIELFRAPFADNNLLANSRLNEVVCPPWNRSEPHHYTKYFPCKKEKSGKRQWA